MAYRPPAPGDDRGMGAEGGFRVLGSGAATFLLISALILLLSFVRLVPSGQVRSQDDPSELENDGAVPEDFLPGEEGGNDPALTQSTGQASRSAQSGASGLECRRDRNGGATDTGVTPTSIKLATTAVQDGEAKTLLENSIRAITAVFNKKNQTGGICGRRLDLTVRNDSFRADFGHQIINNFVSEGYFALPVVPSAEGLGSAIESGDIQRAGIPVIGTDGMRREQYDASGRAAWVWPVATATVSTMRIMAQYGYAEKNARSFAIVYDQKYKFGVEGAQAFREQVAALPGCAPPAGQGPEGSPCLKADRPLNPDDPSYGSQANSFNQACGQAGCDMVAMLLLPDTAKKWVNARPHLGTLFTSGAQTLFTDKFANDCVEVLREFCHAFTVWTGYNPPIGTIAARPGVAEYVNDVRSDVINQFTQGAYLGASVFVKALQAVGPGLTRARLREVMDSMDYQTDLTSGLSWRSGNHWANVRAQGFSMNVTQGTFNGWAHETGFRADPVHGG